jgi:hypothetical protein
MPKSKDELLVIEQKKIYDLSQQLKNSDTIQGLANTEEYEQIMTLLETVTQMVFGAKIYVQEEEPTEPNAVWITTNINNLLQ